MTDKLLSIIDPKIGLGSIIVIGTQAVFWVAYISISMAQLKDLKTTVESLQASMTALSINAPVQTERVVEMGRRLDGLEHSAGELSGRVGVLEQRNVGLRSDIDQFRSQLQNLQSSSDVPIRKPR